MLDAGFSELLIVDVEYLVEETGISVDITVDVELLGEGRMIGSENSVVTDVDIFTVDLLAGTENSVKTDVDISTEVVVLIEEIMFLVLCFVDVELVSDGRMIGSEKVACDVDISVVPNDVLLVILDVLYVDF